MKLNTHLIEQIKNGKAVIQMPPNPSEDNVKLLNSIYESYIGYNPLFFGTRKYYNHYCGSDYNDDGLLPIPLSSFLTQDKQMVSVDEVLGFLKSMRIDEEAYKANGQMYAYGVTDTINNIIEFLTDKTK